MKGKRLKNIRVAVSVLMVTAITLLFIDRYEIFSTVFYKITLWLQFIPSVINFISDAAYLYFGFIIILILTLFFGRVYCSFLCPTGILQDIIDYLFRKFRIHRKNKYTKPTPVTQYTILALTLISIFFFGTLLLNFLDPYSIYGKLANNMVRPVFFAVNNGLSKVLTLINVYSVSPLSYKGFHLISFLVSVFFILLIVVFVGLRGRLYCNTICPVGTFLGLISRFAIFKIRLNKETCTSCIQCVNVCKAGCIDLSTKEIDYSRCVMCFNCLTACKKSCVDIMRLPVKKEVTAIPETDISKRKTLVSVMAYSTALFSFSGLFAQNRNRNRNRYRQGENRDNEHGRGYFRNRLVASPPGSISHEHFNEHCTACNLCVSACPGDVLQPTFLEYGFTSMLQPKMDYSKGYCNYDCVKCGEVCPTGAIRPITVKEKKITQIGIVHFSRHLCVVQTEGTACGSCSEHCPTQAVKMVPFSGDLTIPEINPQICIGCGACEHACPVKDPHVAIFVKGHDVHEIASLPVIEELDDSETGVPEEFPF